MTIIEVTTRDPSPAAPTTATRGAWLRMLAPLALLLGAVFLWARSLPSIDPDRMSDFGLVSVLPPSFLAALLLLTVAFALTLGTCFEWRRYCGTLLVLEIVLLGLVLYGTPALVEIVPRSGTMWQHLGVADYIARHGTVDKTIDAYFNWPGFFVALAFLQRVTGLDSLAGVGAWAPVFFNLLDVLILFGLVKFGARDERTAWLAAWLFLCTNWIGQDILSPQAFGYFVYLNILLLAIMSAPAARRRLLPRRRNKHAQPRIRPDGLGTHATAAPAGPASGGGPATDDRRVLSETQRVLVALSIVVLFGAVAISHQLSPYAIMIVLGAFVLVNVTSLRAMPVLMALIIFVWFTYSAVPFLQQFLHHETSGVGEVQQNISASVTSRIAGPKEHELTVYIRLLLTGLLWGLAVLSALVRLRRGHRDTAFYVIGIAPFLLVGLQSYGGEVVLRIFLFTLPAAVFFVAAALLPAFEARRSLTILLSVLALSIVFLPLFLFARYGNERLDYFSPAEYQTVVALYRMAPPGSEFFVLAPDLPWRWQRYGADRTSYLYQYVANFSNRLQVTPETVANTMVEKRRPTFLIFTPAQRSFATFVGGLTPATVASFERLIARSPRFRPVYSNGSSVIYRAITRATGRRQGREQPRSPQPRSSRQSAG